MATLINFFKKTNSKQKSLHSSTLQQNTSKSSLVKLTAVCALFTPLFLSTTAQAASYYNCANSTSCQLVQSKEATSDYTKTQYPVVMAHGLGGWTRLFGLVDYFHGIPQDLMKGGTEVYTTKVSAMQDSEYRGEQLLQQVKTIAAVTGKEKVNLLGHSHGGHDVRYVAATAPEFVASVTAAASPEQGSKMADWVIKMVTEGSAKDGLPEGEFNLSSKIAIGFFNFVGGFMDVGSDIPLDKLQKQDGWAAVKALSTEQMLDFNKKYPAAMPSEYCGQPPAEYKVNGIPYYSFSGIGQVTNGFDPSDYIMALTGLTFGDDPNDGLVSACSSRLGYVIRDDYKMNHIDSVNHVLGITAWNEVNPISIYRTQINRLKQVEGL